MLRAARASAARAVRRSYGTSLQVPTPPPKSDLVFHGQMTVPKYSLNNSQWFFLFFACNFGAYAGHYFYLSFLMPANPPNPPRDPNQQRPEACRLEEQAEAAIAARSAEWAAGAQPGAASAAAGLARSTCRMLQRTQPIVPGGALFPMQPDVPPPPHLLVAASRASSSHDGNGTIATAAIEGGLAASSASSSDGKRRKTRQEAAATAIAASEEERRRVIQQLEAAEEVFRQELAVSATDARTGSAQDRHDRRMSELAAQEEVYNTLFYFVWAATTFFFRCFQLPFDCATCVGPARGSANRHNLGLVGQPVAVIKSLQSQAGLHSKSQETAVPGTLRTGVMESGSFILVHRDQEWDEVLLVCPHDAGQWLTYSTSEHGDRFVWVLLQFCIGEFRMVVGRDGARRAMVEIMKNTPNVQPILHVAGTAGSGLTELRMPAAGHQPAAAAVPAASSAGPFGSNAPDLAALAQLIEDLKLDVNKHSSSKKGMVRWRSEGKDRKIESSQLYKIDQVKFKKRADLLAFAAKHPGALTASFINTLRLKMAKPGIRRTKDLRDVQLADLIGASQSGLSKVRDVREATTLLTAMDLLNRRDFERAMDVLSMRVMALQQAKAKGGSWEKAASAVCRIAAGAAAMEVIEVLVNTAMTAGGTLQRLVSMGGGRLRPREMGKSSDAVFPLPLLQATKLPSKGRARERAKRRANLLGLANANIALVNWQYAGREEAAYTRLSPTVAQGRAQQVVFDSVHSFLRGVEYASGESEIKEYLLEAVHSYGSGSCHALPLGLRAGVPERAAQVDTADVVRDFDPVMAKQILEPASLLLPCKLRPVKLPRPFAKLAATYPQYVKRNIAAGLQTLKPRHRIHKHRGKALWGGSFAVAKNAEEDRAISALCPLNELVDKSRLWGPKFARMVGKKWGKYTAHPPLPADSRYAEMFPAHCTVPMGFTGAAAWAQGFNESIAMRAELPPDSRLVDGKPVPTQLPVWGSILDDMWAIDEVEVPNEPHAVAHEWMQRVSSEWHAVGVEDHVKKTVNGVPAEEVQGAMIDGIEHWVGVSRVKRFKYIEAGLYLLSQPCPLVAAVDRWVGKGGFAQSFKTCCRSTYADIYTWLNTYRGKRRRARLWPSVQAEMIASMLEIPFMQTNLSAQWCTRVEASDASPGGHGRAWTQMRAPMVAEACRLCEGKGVYTSLNSEFGLALDEAGRCPLQQLQLDHTKFTWSTAARPGGYKHITREEGAALVWSLHDRLRRPYELHHRVLHLIDSAALTGAVKKGRSASRNIHGLCRQVSAIVKSGDFEPFYPWVPTDKNPADEPSSRFGIRVTKPQPEPARIVSCSTEEGAYSAPPCLEGGDRLWAEEDSLVKHFIVVNAAAYTPGCYDGRELPSIALHLCSGKTRPGDYADQLCKLAIADGKNLVVLRIDPLNHATADLLRLPVVKGIYRLIDARRVIAAMHSPPCSTISRARHVPLENAKCGPRPLRARGLGCIRTSGGPQASNWLAALWRLQDDSIGGLPSWSQQGLGAGCLELHQELNRSSPWGLEICLPECLISTLKEKSQASYIKALTNFKSDLEELAVDWSRTSDEEKDYILADILFERMTQNQSRQDSVILVAALHKISPGKKLPGSRKFLEAWASTQPISQAPACPEEVAFALANLAVAVGQSAIGAAMLLTFCGLRIGEAIALVGDKVVFMPDAVILFIDVSKRVPFLVEAFVRHAWSRIAAETICAEGKFTRLLEFLTGDVKQSSASLREDRGVCLESIVSYESMPFPDEISPLPLEVSCGLAFPEKRPGETQKKGKAARSKISPLPLEVSCGLAFPEKRPGETQKKGKAARSKTSWCDESAIEQSMGMEPWGDMGQ
ncbi:unnamed protein product, partial [Polarella glacialis]